MRGALGLKLDMRLVGGRGTDLVLGPELITQPLDISTGWTASSCTIDTATQFTLTATNGRVFKDLIVNGKKYQTLLTGSVTAGSLLLQNASNSEVYAQVDVVTNFTATGNLVGILNSLGGIGAVSSDLTLSIKEILN